MWAESEEGVGSTFSFTVRLGPVASRPRPFTHADRGVLEGRQALIVDDNATNLRILTRQMGNWGLVPHVADSAEAALRLLRGGQSFDVAVLDMHMPEVDGVMLAREIRKIRTEQELPLVLFSSLGQRPPEGLFAASLTKPGKPTQLGDALARVLAGRAPAAKTTPPIGEPVAAAPAETLPRGTPAPRGGQPRQPEGRPPHAP
jgi:CheY-like chemotaxis protein